MSDLVPTVTIYGDVDDLTESIADEFAARGAATHVISVPSGWLKSSHRALLRLDHAAGRAAVEDLCDCDSSVHVVAVAADEPGSQVVDWCERCATRHDLAVWRIGEDATLVSRIAERVLEHH